MQRAKLLAVFILLLSILLPATVQAQSDTVIGQLTVRIWPEFDQPSALVIINGQVSPETTVPVELTFNLPETAQVNAVAIADQNGLINAPDTVVEGTTVGLTSPNGTFHIEFYDTALDVSTASRTYALNWALDYTVTELIIEVQQPPSATDFVVSPSGGNTFADNFGLNSYGVTQSGLAAGNTINVDLSYTKTDSALTVAFVENQNPTQTEPVAPAPTNVAAGETNRTVTIIVFAVLAVALIGGGVYLFLNSNKLGQSSPTARAPQGKGAASQSFCTNCGKPAHAGDKFCRHCGQQIA